MNITLTKTEALAIQAKQLDHYASVYGEAIRARVAAITHPERLDDEPHPVWEVASTHSVRRFNRTDPD